jgi:hypothetical protein
MLCYRHLHSSIDGIPFYWCLKLTQPSKRKILCQLDIWNFQDLACPARFERATYALERHYAEALPELSGYSRRNLLYPLRAFNNQSKPYMTIDS